MINYESVLVDINNWCDIVGNFQIKELQARNFKVSNKQLAIDYVTDVDIETEKMLTRFIKDKYPGHCIIGEEFGNSNNCSDFAWIIDPIDGTTNYIHGFPTFCISIALEYRGKTKVGMVYAPMLYMKYSAIEGKGSYLNGKRIKVTDNTDFAECLLGTGFQTNRCIDNINIRYFKYLIEHVCDIRQVGSTALALCFTASGWLDGFWHFDIKKWDYCAAQLILEESNGIVKHYHKDGHELLIGGKSSVYHQLEKIIVKDVYL